MQTGGPGARVITPITGRRGKPWWGGWAGLNGNPVSHDGWWPPHPHPGRGSHHPTPAHFSSGANFKVQFRFQRMQWWKCHGGFDRGGTREPARQFSPGKLHGNKWKATNNNKLCAGCMRAAPPPHVPLGAGKLHRHVPAAHDEDLRWARLQVERLVAGDAQLLSRDVRGPGWPRLWRQATPHSMAQAARHRTPQRNTSHTTQQQSTAQHSSTQHIIYSTAAQHNTAQHNTTQHNAIHHNAIQRSTTQYITHNATDRTYSCAVTLTTSSGVSCKRA